MHRLYSDSLPVPALERAPESGAMRHLEYKPIAQCAVRAVRFVEAEEKLKPYTPAQRRNRDKLQFKREYIDTYATN